jgi:coenzyme Q-binding protein COQ10
MPPTVTRGPGHRSRNLPDSHARAAGPLRFSVSSHTREGMPKSTTQVESFVSPEEFRALVLDFESYPEFLPEVKRVTVTHKDGERVTALFNVEVSVGGMDIKTDYTVVYTLGASEIRWQLVASPTLTKNEGFWRIEETADGETRATYENEIVTSLPIPLELQKLFADQELPRMMQRFRDRAEG